MAVKLKIIRHGFCAPYIKLSEGGEEFDKNVWKGDALGWFKTDFIKLSTFL